MKIVKKAIRMAKKVYKSNKLTKILIFLSFVLIVMFVVKKERNMSADLASSLANGQVYSGYQALKY